MKAMVITAGGPPEVLHEEERPIPVLPSESHVLIRVHAAGVNPADAKRRNAGTGMTFPAILGFDGAGVVDRVGRDVQRFKPGAEVYFLQNGLGAGPGCYAEYTTLHEEYVAAKPSSLSMIEAAAVPLVFITMWEALFDRGRLQAGQTMLIHAGAGGTGHVGIQLAKHHGARVATTVSDDDKAAWVSQLGAELVIRYKDEDFVERTLDWTERRGVDAVVDTVGGETLCKSFAAARVYGHVLTLLDLKCEARALGVARQRNQSLTYVLMLTPMMLDMHDARVGQRIMLDRAAAFIDAGHLNVKVNHVLPLDRAADAHRLIESGGTAGKVVLAVPGVSQ